MCLCLSKFMGKIDRKEGKAMIHTFWKLLSKSLSLLAKLEENRIISIHVVKNIFGVSSFIFRNL